MKNVEIYTDGGCRGNGQDRENIGGIGGVLIYGDYQKEFKKGYRNTTTMVAIGIMSGVIGIFIAYLKYSKKDIR